MSRIPVDYDVISASTNDLGPDDSANITGPTDWRKVGKLSIPLIIAGLLLIVITSGTGMSETGPAWGALALIGLVGALMIVVGVFILLYAFARHDWQDQDAPIADTDSGDYQDLARELLKNEVVKEIKSTIKVRCRYCGTLNDEGATNCEACGATL